MRSSPSVKLTGNGLVPQRSRPGRIPNLFRPTGFARQAARAKKLTRECDLIRTSLEKKLAAQEKSRTIPRYRAMAAFTALMLQLTKVNLIGFHGWCNEIAPGIVSTTVPAFEPPEVDRVDRTRRPVGVWFSNYSLCHGVRPFFDVELPGGVLFRKELRKLDSMVRAFENRSRFTFLSCSPSTSASSGSSGCCG